MRKKVPPPTELPSTKKSALYSENPSGYRSQKIAWRFSLLDDDSRWSLRTLSKVISCSIEEKDLEAIVNGNLSHPSFYDSVIDVSRKQDHESVAHYMKRITEGVNGHIDPVDLRYATLQMDFKFFYDELISRLKAQESMTWSVIESATHGKKGKSNSHEIPIHKIIPEAQKRLAELELEDYETIFSLRLGGQFRVWGFRNANVLEILWIDRYHEICPSINN